jgi:hypothetical protein
VIRISSGGAPRAAAGSFRSEVWVGIRLWSLAVRSWWLLGLVLVGDNVQSSPRARGPSHSKPVPNSRSPPEGHLPLGGTARSRGILRVPLWPLGGSGPAFPVFHAAPSPATGALEDHRLAWPIGSVIRFPL